MQQLAEKGANFNYADYRGRGPIHIASINGDMKAIVFLIKEKVNLDLLDNTGKSALYYACVYKHEDIVDLLVEKGATLIVQQSKLIYMLL